MGVGRQAGLLLLRDGGVLPGIVAKVERPGQRPGETRDAENHERTAPGERQHQRGHERRRDRIADARESVREALRDAALRSGRPVGHGAGGGRERGAFSQTEQHPRREHRRESAGEAGQDRRAGPHQRAEQQGAARAEAVAEPAADDLEHEIGIGEGGKHQAHLGVAEREFALERGGRRADVDAVHVGDEVHQAQQREHFPARPDSRVHWSPGRRHETRSADAAEPAARSRRLEPIAAVHGAEPPGLCRGILT